MSAKKSVKQKVTDMNKGSKISNQPPTISHVLGGDYNITIGGDVVGNNIVANKQSDTSKSVSVKINAHDIENILKDKKRVIEKLNLTLSVYEIIRMSFELGVDYDDLSGETKIQKISSLLETFELRNIFPEFLAFLKKTHPSVFDILSQTA